MNLKDQLNLDLENIFFNTEEFGETHKIEGITAQCILQGNTSKTGETLAECENILIISASEYEGQGLDILMPGDIINIDNKIYIISNWDTQGGAHFIKITSKEQF